jgi:hypothetical protein
LPAVRRCGDPKPPHPKLTPLLEELMHIPIEEQTELLLFHINILSFPSVQFNISLPDWTLHRIVSCATTHKQPELNKSPIEEQELDRGKVQEPSDQEIPVQ